MSRIARRCETSPSIRISVLVGIFFITPVFIHAQVDGILCTDGEGAFKAKSSLGVTVTLGASKSDGLANRSCEAVLSYRGKTVKAVQNAWQADLELMDAYLGFHNPVVGIQFKDREADRQMTYAVYSLDNTLQLLRILAGGDFYRTEDFHLDGHIEIRTGDVAAVDGFDGIPLSSFDFAPPVYLRFEGDKLIDVSIEFQPEYDRAIGELKASLDPDALRAFKATDGRLDSIFLMPAVQMHSLVTTKIKVLEIVWCYLASSREAAAWNALSEMWPSSDIDRVRTAILEAQKHGIRQQVDGVSTSPPPVKIKHLHIYDTPTELRNSGLPSGAPNRAAWMTDANPKPIYLHSGCAAADCAFKHSAADYLFDLRVDDAGKVFAAKLVDDTVMGPDIDMLLKSALSWKFIPAYKNGRPVACRVWQIVSSYR